MAERTISELLSSMMKRIDLLERRGMRKNGGSGSLKVTQLGSSDNLNDIYKLGIYECPHNNYASDPNNYPLERSGILEVIEGDQRILQRYSAESGLTSLTWERFFYNGSWGQWRIVGDFARIANYNVRLSIHNPYSGLYVLENNGYGYDWSNNRWRLCTTPWINLTVRSGYGVHSGYTPQMRLLNGVLYARGAISKNSGSFGDGYEVIATVPTGINNAFSDPGWATVSTLHGAGGHLTFRGYWDSGRDLRVYYSRATGSQSAAYTTINGFSGKIIDD